MQKALEALPGVVQVTADGNTKTATCFVEKGKFDVEKAIIALTEAGYDHSTVQK